MNRRALLKAAIVLPAAAAAAPFAVQIEPSPAAAANALALRDTGLISRAAACAAFGFEDHVIFDRFEDALVVQHFTWPKKIKVAGALPPGTMEQIFGGGKT